LAQDGVYLCFGDRARAGRCDLALPVSDFVKERKCWLTICTPPPTFFVSADSKRVTAAFFGSADSEGLRGLFCSAWRRLFLSNTTEDIIIVT
jgi:hypothetical protein